MSAADDTGSAYAPVPEDPDRKPEGEAAHHRAQAVSELFREHNRTLVRFLESRLQNEHEAREIAQEAYVRLLELGRTGAVGFLRSYLFRIAANLAVDRIRSRAAHRRIDTRLPDTVDDLVDEAAVEKQVFAADEMRVFWSCLAELPSHYRQALVLSRLQGLTTGEIARQLSRSDRMVRRYLVHAMLYCRHRIGGLSPDQARQLMETERNADE